MLQQVLNEIESAQYAVNVPQLAKKLHVEEGALRGMIDFWVRKGRVSLPSVAADTSCDGFVCRCCPSGGSCPVGVKTTPLSGQ